MLTSKRAVFTVLLFVLTTTAASQQAPQQDPAAVATLGQVFMGPVDLNTVAMTTVLVTNRDLKPCATEIFFHQGSEFGDPLPRINDQQTDFLRVTIPRGGIDRFDLTADQLTVGIATILTECDPDSLRVQGTYSILESNQQQGGLSESFTIQPNNEQSWLSQGKCLAISTEEGTGSSGIRQSLGIAVSSVLPGQPAPAGTSLEMMLFDGSGNFVDETSVPVSGKHTPFFLFSGSFSGFSGPATIIVCLEGSDPNYNLDLTIVRVNERGPDFQYDAAIVVDRFKSGDVSAWSR